MTVVRELVTRLGFQVDRSGLGVMERAISGFRSRVVFTASSIKDFAFAAANYLGDVAKANIDVSELARNTGTSVERFAALREAAKQFRFEPQQFDHTFTRLSELLREAKSGYGEVYEIARKSRGELNLVPFAQTGDVEGALKAVLKYTESLKDSKDQVAALRDIIGGGAENSLLRVIDGGIDKFNAAADANRDFGKSFAEGINDQKKYLENLQQLETKLDGVKQKAINLATPAVSKGLDFIDKGLQGIEIIQNVSATEGKEAGRNFLGQAIADSVYRLLGYEPLVDVQNKIAEDELDFQRRLFAYQKQQREMQQQTTINNRVDINVAPGTPEEQKMQIAELVRDEMESFYDEKNREVISNSPQVE